MNTWVLLPLAKLQESYLHWQGLSQDLSYLSFGQVVSYKPPVWTGNNFHDDFSILTYGV